jgi:two-component system, chemotaxis family, chemotaxis protein CheY
VTERGALPERAGEIKTKPADQKRPSAGPILVVDDDLSIRLAVTEILEFEGYQVTTAANGAEALETIERVRPSLVLLDMRMPVLDGWGFARELRKRGVKLPILVMTAAQSASRWAAEIGAQGYLAKPFDLVDLLRAVGEAQTDG